MERIEINGLDTYKYNKNDQNIGKIWFKCGFAIEVRVIITFYRSYKLIVIFGIYSNIMKALTFSLQSNYPNNFIKNERLRLRITNSNKHQLLRHGKPRQTKSNSQTIINAKVINLTPLRCRKTTIRLP